MDYFNIKILNITLLTWWMVVLGCQPIHAQSLGETQKLTASDADTDNGFGSSVSISGDTMVIGTPYDNDHGSGSGSAYVFTRDARGVWTEQQKLTASDAGELDRFGASVSISRDTVVIGSMFSGNHGNEYGTGSVYVFARDARGVWTEKQKLTASDADDADQFGQSVSISGDSVVIGASNDNDLSGLAYVFTRNARGVWTEKQKLTAGDADESDRFGVSVSISGDTVVIGTPYNDDHGELSGSAYVFMLDDTDYDGISNNVDNCPDIYNPLQADFDLNGKGTLCDPDEIFIISGDFRGMLFDVFSFNNPLLWSEDKIWARLPINQQLAESFAQLT